jgi:DNA-binding transcriptional LysR family regulator
MALLPSDSLFRVHSANGARPSRLGLPPALRKYLRHSSLKQLAVFDACVRQGSFSKAGQVLHLAQPTVSVQMKQLSEALGVQLFEPKGKSVQPTPAGRALFEACQPLFDCLATIDEQLEPFRQSAKKEEPRKAALHLASSA